MALLRPLLSQRSDPRELIEHRLHLQARGRIIQHEEQRAEARIARHASRQFQRGEVSRGDAALRCG